MKIHINKIKLVLMVCLSLSISMSFGQISKISALKVGDTIPEIILKGFLRDSLRQQKLSDFYKNKLLLIDLSATWCSPCVAAWPELDSIKKASNGDLQVLIVTQEKRKVVQKFFQRNVSISKLDMDFIADNIQENPVLFHEFPHKSVPEVVWINQKGIVIAITDSYKVTAENIRSAMNDQSVRLPVKKDVMEFDQDNYELADSLPLFSSMLTRYKPGILGLVRYLPLLDSPKRTLVSDILVTDQDIVSLYREAAFHETISLTNQERFVVDLPDSIRLRCEFDYYRDKTTDKDITSWLDKNGYCYELKTNSAMPEGPMYSKMISDLNLYLNLNGHFEKRLLPCWLLKSSAKQRLRTEGAIPKISYYAGTPQILQNQPISRLIEILNNDISTGQVLDNTGITGNIDVELTGCGFGTTPEVINKILKKSAFYLEKSRKFVEVFVLSPAGK
jgi:thiol-disulfide isomerase/thioredoxin